MKLAFTHQELYELASMRARLAEFRRIAPEVELGKNQIPDLHKAAQSARQAVDSILPSELIAFTNKVAIAFSALTRAEMTRSAVTVSTETLSGRLSTIRNELACWARNFQQTLTAKVKNDPLLAQGYVSKEIAEILNRLEATSRRDIADSVEALLTLAKELGAELEVSA